MKDFLSAVGAIIMFSVIMLLAAIPIAAVILFPLILIAWLVMRG